MHIELIFLKMFLSLELDKNEEY